MSQSLGVVIWILSFLVLLGFVYLGYKVSYKLGIKKALYRTTYILFSVICSFALTPLVTNELFNLDLTQFDIVLTYKTKDFTTIIDYLEEVVAHSEFLNDLYAYFPSLKDLFMDFPQLLVAPLTYVLLFGLFMLVWLPLYLYLSYKRKRRVLYERPDNKTHRIWAGILGAVQIVFIMSVVLSPINEINRVYQNAIKDTLDEEYDSLCDGNVLLEEYKSYCDILQVYDSTIFATIGGNKSLSNYTFDSLTRITYNGGYTTFSKEASLIVKSGIVLNQSGLLDVISQDLNSIPMPLLMQKEFSDEDIDIIVDTLSNSKYSEDLLVELEDLTYNTLNDAIGQILGEKAFQANISMTNEEAIEEIKIVLKALPVLVNSTLIQDIMDVKSIVEEFVYEIPDNLKDDRVIFAFMLDLFEQVNIDEFELLCEYLFESKIVNSILPYILNTVFGQFGFDFVNTDGDVLDQFYNFMDFGRLLKKYKPIDFFDFIQKLNDEELMMAGDIINYICSSKDSEGFVRFLFSCIFSSFEIYPIDDIINVSDWTREMYVLRDICILLEGILYEDSVNYELIWKLWNNKQSEVAAIGRDIVVSNSGYLTTVIIKALEK